MCDETIDWRDLRCTEHVYSINYKGSVKGEPMRAISAHESKKCRCDACVLAKKLKGAERYRENRERIREQQRKYYAGNSEKFAERNSKYWKTQAGKAVSLRKELKRRSADQEFFENMTEDEHAEFFNISEYFHPLLETHVDHVVPVSMGGTSHPRNLAVLTEAENLYKSGKHPLDCDLVTVPLAGRYRVDSAD